MAHEKKAADSAFEDEAAASLPAISQYSIARACSPASVDGAADLEE